MMKSEPLRPTAESPSTVAMSVVRGILHAAESIGITSDTLCEAAGLDYARVQGVRRVTGTQFAALWEAVARLSGDPYCGLRIGERTNPSSAHIVGYLLMNCMTVDQAIERYLRYQQIVGNMLELRLNQNQGCSHLTLQILDHTLRYSRHLVEWVIAGEAVLLRELGSKPIKPVKVWFTHPAPDDTTEYQSLFQAPVLFGQPVNALVLSAIDLAVPIRQADPELFSIFESQAQDYLKSLDRSTCYKERVRRIVIKMITDGRPSIDKVSAELKMGTRSLQLKLRAEGTSYQEILGDIRKYLALRYLEHDTVSVSEVGYLLGFSEPSVFHRAFRRWTGKTPGAYRKIFASKSLYRHGSENTTQTSDR